MWPLDLRRFRWPICGLVVACAPAEAYRWRNDIVGVEFDAPPVLLQMVDSRGRRIGVDFTRTVDADGYATYGNYFWDGDEFRSTSGLGFRCRIKPRIRHLRPQDVRVSHIDCHW